MASRTGSPVRVLAQLLFLVVLVVTAVAGGAQAASAQPVADAPVATNVTSLDGMHFSFATTGPYAVADAVDFGVVGDSVALASFRDRFGSMFQDFADNTGDAVSGAKDAIGAAIFSIPGTEVTANALLQCGNKLLAVVGLPNAGTDCDGALAELAKSAVSSVLAPAVDAVFKVFNDTVRAGAIWAFNFVFEHILMGGGDASSDYQHGMAAPNLTGEWFQSPYLKSLEIALFLVVPLAIMVVIQSILKGSLFFLLRAIAVMLPVSVLGGAVIVYFTRQMLWIADDMSLAISNNILNVSDYKAWTDDTLNTWSDGIQTPIVTVWMLVAILGVLVIWVELILREMGVYLAAFFLPLAFAGLVWPATAKFARRLLEILIALIFSKVIIVAALSVGLAAIGKSDMAATPSSDADAVLTANSPAPDVDAGLYAAPPASPNIGTNGMQQSEDFTALSSLIAGAAIVWMAGFAGTKILEIGPGLSAAAEARLAQPNQIWNKGYGLQAVGGSINRRLKANRDSIAPRADFANPMGGGGSLGGDDGSKGGGGKGGGGGDANGLAAPVKPSGTPSDSISKVKGMAAVSTAGAVGGAAGAGIAHHALKKGKRGDNALTNNAPQMAPVRGGATVNGARTNARMQDGGAAGQATSAKNVNFRNPPPVSAKQTGAGKRYGSVAGLPPGTHDVPPPQQPVRVASPNANAGAR